MNAETVTSPVEEILHLVERLNRDQRRQLMRQLQEQLRREELFAQANADFADLWADPEAAADWREEQAAWDATLADGLERV